jgi:hypothetical protein
MADDHRQSKSLRPQTEHTHSTINGANNSLSI